MKNIILIFTIINICYSICYGQCNCSQNTGQLLVDNLYINCCRNTSGVVKICGNFTSNNNEPAIKFTYIDYEHPNTTVILENSIIEGSGEYLVFSGNYNGGYYHKIIIRNNFFRGKNTIQCQTSPVAIYITNPSLINIENNTFEDCHGVMLVGSNVIESTYERLIISKNVFKNIDGRVSKGITNEFYTASDFHYNNPCVTTKPKPWHGIQLHSMRGLKSAKISWNEFINEPDKSAAGDVINIYESSGLSESNSLEIDNNFIKTSCAYPSDDNFFVGGGILIADSRDHECRNNETDELLSPAPVECPANTTRIPPYLLNSCRYVNAYNNQVVNTVNYGIAIAYGRDCKIINNRIVSTQKLQSTKDFYKSIKYLCSIGGVNSKTSGIYVHPFYYGHNNSTTNYDSIALFNNNIVTNNIVKWTSPTDCKYDLSSHSNCSDVDSITENFIFTNGFRCEKVKLPTEYNFDCTNNYCAQATFEDEEYEYQLWKKRLSDNNIRIGVIPNGSDVLARQVPTGIQQNQTYTAYNQVFATNETILLPNVIMQLSDFSFITCATNNNPTIPSAKLESEQTRVINNQNSSFSIYPNPTTGKLNIEIEDNIVTQLKISLYSSLGTGIFTNKLIDKINNTFSINLDNLNDGIYYIVVNDKLFVSTLKVIIRK